MQYELVTKLKQVHHKLCLTAKQVGRLRLKISKASERQGLSLDDQTHEGLQQVMQLENVEILFPRHIPEYYLVTATGNLTERC